MEGIDLLKLSSELERRNLHPELVKQVKRVRSVASAHQDLCSAGDAIALLRKKTEERRQNADVPPGVMGIADPDDSTTAAALLAHAAILYSRATETKPIDRWKWFSRSLLTAGEREWHADVMHFRDKALAHFGTGDGLVEGPILADALVLKKPTMPNQIEVVFVENRAGTRARIAAELALLIEKLRKLAREKWNSQLGGLYDAFCSAAESGSDFANLVRLAPFDPQHVGIQGFPRFEPDSQELSSHYFIRRRSPNVESEPQ